MKNFPSKSWIEVSKSAITSNVRMFVGRLGKKTSMMAVIKANAYGHGAALVAKTAVAAGAKWLAVDNLDEAAEVSSVCPSTPILVLGYTPLAHVKDVADTNVRITIYSLASARAAAAAKGLVRVHIKFETGTARQGVMEDELVPLLTFLKTKKNVVVEGLSTHYANIEDTTDHRYAALQLARFIELSRIAEETYGKPIPVKHTACSAAALLFPETYFTLARVGISLYGLWPSRETRLAAEERRMMAILAPALTWKTIVAQVKDVAKGTPISYGLTVRMKRASRIAVLPVGYADGFDRGLSSLGEVLIRGERAPILGRVCMNMCMVDVTDIPGVAIEDEVVLLGTQKDESITAEEIASKLGTINYEVVARLSSRLPRILR